MEAADWIFWLAVFLLLSVSIVMVVTKTWYLYSRFILFLSIVAVLVGIISYFNIPNSISNVWFGIAFLIFPIADGTLTNIAIRKYGAKEANPVMAFAMRIWGVNAVSPVPFVAFLMFVIFYWNHQASDTLLVLYVAYFSVIVNNVVSILIKRRKVAAERAGQRTG
jgi:hypothetical protein